MKRFFYGAVGLLCLAAAFHLGAETASTCYVDRSCVGVVAHTHCRQSGVKVLDEDGVVWAVSQGQGWQEDATVPPFPFAPIEVRFFASSGAECSVVTCTNEAWVYDGHGDWVNCGVWPGDTAVQRTSWTDIKARYRDDGNG